MSYISMFLGNIIAIIYTPIMLRLLGQNEYGLYQLAGSVVSYLGLLSFGFGSAYVRFFSKYRVQKDDVQIAKLNGMYIIIFTAIGLLALLAGSILVVNTQFFFGAKLSADDVDKTKILLGILVLNIAISFPFSVFDSYLAANEQFLFQRIISLIKTLANPLIMLPILLLGYKAVGIVIASTILNILISIINMTFCLQKLKMKFEFRNFNLSLFKEVAIFSSYIFINIVVDQINWNVDKFILGVYQGAIAVAIYGLAAQLNTYYMSFSTSISSVFIPRVNQLVAKSNDDKEITDIFTRVGRIQFIVLALILSGLILFGKPFIAKWAGENYIDSYLILIILVIPVTIPLIQNLGIEIQRAKNLHKFRSWLYLGVAIANVCISIPLCKAYSGLGCAIGTSASLFLGNGLIMNIYYHKKCGIDIKFFWSEISEFLPSFILPIIFGIIVIKFVDLYYIPWLVLCGIAYIMIFCISIWLFGLNEYEKDLFRGPMLKIIKKLKSVKS